VDYGEQSEAQLQEGDRLWGGSVERNCEPMDKNRIEGVMLTIAYFDQLKFRSS